ncbi:disulfide bond formation protein DsbA [Actinophytocola sp.]|uniref:mycothiol-dependent nitroreductase Rv2466c family protein n=1 Tax=Actinophytocola sp. TaxID=1872138 RepID=UPI003D6B13E5
MSGDLSAGSTYAVDVWVDPLCPWAWQTARWLLEVERTRRVPVGFQVMSLAVLNEGRVDVDQWYRFLARRGWGPVRVCVTAVEKYGEEVLRPLYLAMAERIHRRREGWGPGMLRGALADVGLDQVLADAAGRPEHDEAVRESHAAGVRPAGDAAGTPMVHMRRTGGPGGDFRTAFFGPVLSPAPAGEDAGRLWDALCVMAEMPGFAELRRPRQEAAS